VVSPGLSSILVMRTSHLLRLLMGLLGGGLLLAGAVLLVPSLLGVVQRGSTDRAVLHHWLGPSGAITHVLTPMVDTSLKSAAACGTGSVAQNYALLAFPTLPGTEGVAANGGWNLLTQRSVVHYGHSPAPGATGNVIIALHREPNFENLNQLHVGSPITVTDRNCHRWTYRVTQIWVLSPNQVTQLNPVASGHVLTLVTCTPLWIDTQRLVIRATLVG